MINYLYATSEVEFPTTFTVKSRDYFCVVYYSFQGYMDLIIHNTLAQQYTCRV